MSESKSRFGDYHEMGARMQAFDQGFEDSCCSNLQLVLCKRSTLLAASLFVSEGLFIYIYYLTGALWPVSSKAIQFAKSAILSAHSSCRAR